MQQEQFSLGQLITEIEKHDLKNDNSDKEIYFDFAYFKPTFLSSWRGSYDQLSLGYKSDGVTTAKNLLENLKTGLTEVFEGWKGGEYYMNKDTLIWIAEPNESCHTGITGVIDDGYRLVILTGYFEY